MRGQYKALIAILPASICGYLLMRSAFVTSQKPDLSADSWKVLTDAVAVWDIGPLPSVTMDLENTVNYQLNSTTYNNAQWSALAPGGGIVHLGPNHTPYLPSFFHQLRCLDIIRLFYAAQEQDMINKDAKEAAAATHCLNYLRQMLFCRSDLNLESVISGDPDHHAVASRRTQTCRDWRVVYEALGRNQAIGGNV
ncbi:uncharacterized protein BT62DRAFT_275440 [Guyanagaster necrorhizus]|uniref:Tat pathway signal sequence n=1 Tax=Guyanagaster necrorhizus TaxID=856835 RepID=A0A9P7W4I0_9AGAR|nr:uncharacterized protein BT62DRAFT_275440 [Guyanagaster necrorhizus MCA 3950]KAG7452003.1 hypothetical protein BT62DRAFT_275440 [Guyanagaster necrorhizus MCA 3950]